MGWIVFLIYILISVTEQFFCPSLSTISTSLKLSNSVAVSIYLMPRSNLSTHLTLNQGVTFLAIGNAAPDFFSSFAASVHGAPRLALSAVLG